MQVRQTVYRASEIVFTRLCVNAKPEITMSIPSAFKGVSNSFKRIKDVKAVKIGIKFVKTLERAIPICLTE